MLPSLGVKSLKQHTHEHTQPSLTFWGFSHNFINSLFSWMIVSSKFLLSTEFKMLNYSMNTSRKLSSNFRPKKVFFFKLFQSQSPLFIYSNKKNLRIFFCRVKLTRKSRSECFCGSFSAPFSDPYPISWQLCLFQLQKV